jgi:hypothetical protein
MFLSGFSSAQAQSKSDLCRNSGVVVAFLNGVLTTPMGANNGLEAFQAIHSNTSPNGDQIKYELLYNQTNGFSDFVETFDQRLQEQDRLLEGRYELFFEALTGEGPWWSKLVAAVPASASILTAFANWVQAQIVQKLTTLIANPPTLTDYASHRSRISTWVVEGKKILFVAHSQGNLFANAAYDYAISKSTAESVKLVHIAPASPILNGSHTLADKDLVINGLRLAGTVASNTDVIPGYQARPKSTVSGKGDPLGHGLLEIYINQQLAIASSVKKQIESALVSLAAPRNQEASQGFFTATLIWNGAGDTDLHTDEPGGAHVYYGNRTGDGGFLDVDNTSADGPEHFYASCDSSVLQTGLYKFSVANFSGADGRVATIQIASDKDGVLGTRSVVLGEATGSNPGSPLFNVQVSKDSSTGKYSVSIR